ncbi:putative pentatricopeptide [Rosa chinensis]|uniref:Putative pentatricopeptide n=1 Tax=Rosa chinensis TaxID=74649 RepID=A0A2P6RFB4_ROSCH|nr:putative pentatricopeptide [Rosa chinensis]
MELGREIHDYVRAELKFTTIIGNLVLHVYAMCGYLSEARKVFDEIPLKNVLCWTTMMNGYVNCGMLDEARKLFDRSLTKDVVLWTAMMNGMYNITNLMKQWLYSKRCNLDEFKWINSQSLHSSQAMLS